MNELIKKYVLVGVHQNKIITVKQPSVIWSLTRKCIVGTGIEPLEVIYDENGNGKISFENNRSINLKVRTKLTKEDVDEINNSNGIICMMDNRGYYRYEFIPTR